MASLTILDALHLSVFNPSLIDTIKIAAVSIGWIGSLTTFILWKDKHSQAAK